MDDEFQKTKEVPTMPDPRCTRNAQSVEINKIYALLEERIKVGTDYAALTCTEDAGRAERSLEVLRQTVARDPLAKIDFTGMTNWTDIFACDCRTYHRYIPVYDPYATCQIVICAVCNGGTAVGGPILSSP